MLSPRAISNRSAATATQNGGEIGNICVPCQRPVRVYAVYDDLWQTPVVAAPLRISDANGLLIEGPKTLALANHGLADGMPIREARKDLGRREFQGAQPGRVYIQLLPDPGAEADAQAAADQIYDSLDGFQRDMETSLLPWITQWNAHGILSIPAAYRSGAVRGLSEWWKAEAGFWANIGNWVSGAFAAATQAAITAAVEAWEWYEGLSAWDKLNPLGAYARELIGDLLTKANELWERRGEIMTLVQAFASGVTNDIQAALGALVSLPGEIGEIITELVRDSAEWAGLMNEMIRETDILEAVATSVFGIIMMMTPNLWAEALGTVGGYILPEVLIAVIFLILAAFTEGAAAPLLVMRLTQFATKIKNALKAAGKVGPLLVKIFNRVDDLRKLMVKLVKALKRKIDEGVEGVTDAWNKITRRSSKLRQAYVREVEALSAKGARMRRAGSSSEEIARSLHADRRALGVKYKDLTPPDKLAEIYARNIDKYGDRLGPSIEYLRGRGKTWDQIIESAARPGGKDLGL